MLTWTQLLPLVCWGSPLLFTKGTCSPSLWPATSGSSMESTLPLFPANFLSSFAIRRQGSSQDVTPWNSSKSRPWTTPYPFSLTSTKKPLGASHHARCLLVRAHTHTDSEASSSVAWCRHQAWQGCCCDNNFSLHWCSLKLAYSQMHVRTT